MIRTHPEDIKACSVLLKSGVTQVWHSYHFWERKFEYCRLEIFEIFASLKPTFLDWIEEYGLCDEARIKADKLMTLFRLEKEKSPSDGIDILVPLFPEDQRRKFTPLELHRLMGPSLHAYEQYICATLYYDNNEPTQHCLLNYDGVIIDKHIKTDEYGIRVWLTRVLYHDPQRKIFDIGGAGYIQNSQSCIEKLHERYRFWHPERV